MEMKQNRTKKFLKKVAGMTKLDDGLKRLDKMTNDEVRMANAEEMRMIHEIDTKVEGVDKRVRGVDENVKLVAKKMQMIIDDGKEVAAGARLTMQQTANDVNDVKRRRLRESLRKWQSPSDPSTNHNFACNRQHGRTTEWFGKGYTSKKWKATGSFLWIHGKPGSGKSILCSAIINDIATLHKAGSASLAYFYFDFRDVDKQSRRDLLSSLLIQLAARSDPFCDILSELYKEHDDGTHQPSDSALIRCLKDMLTLPDQVPVYLILDALDECPNTSGVPSTREQVLALVKELVDLRLPNLHICATSRPEVDIHDALASLAPHSVSLHDEKGQRKDIAKYVKSVVNSESVRAKKRWRDEDKALVIRTLLDKANGMFRWVFCQLERLQNCLRQNIPRVLSEAPASLDETYERILREIWTDNRNHAHRLLQCLMVAIRPLRVEELAEILALDFDDTKDGVPQLKEDWRLKDQQEAVLSMCSSLISVEKRGDHHVVQFSHFSVKEFLTSDRLAASSPQVSPFHVLPEPAHTVIVKACLGILLRSDDGVGDVGRTRSPLNEYAARYWAGHARFEKVSTHIEDALRRLFDPAKPFFQAWLNLYELDRRWHTFAGYGAQHRGSPLYYASFCGLRNLAAHLVAEHPTHVNATFGRCLSPLVAALYNRHFDVAELLCQRGADVDIKSDFNRTPLHAALVDEYVDITEWLLAHGADAMLPLDGHETPLHFSVTKDKFQFVRMLLRYRAGVNAKNGVGRTPLHLASEDGQVESVRLLLQHEADVDARDQSHNTPLHLATSLECVDIMKSLLEHGANVDAMDRTQSTPLHLALSNITSRGLESVPLLIEHGADINAQDHTNSTPLHLASLLRRTKTMQMLITHGADVNAQSRHHKTPLHLVSRGKTGAQAARLLIEHGADVNAQDTDHKTPLHLASSIGRQKTVKLLIERGADVNAHDKGYSTPLHLAASPPFACDGTRNIGVVHLLLSHGANVDEKDDSGQTPFQIASSNGLSEIAKLLSNHRVRDE